MFLSKVLPDLQVGGGGNTQAIQSKRERSCEACDDKLKNSTQFRCK